MPADKPADTLAPLKADIDLLGRMLGEVISHFEGAPMLARVEKIRRLAQKARAGDTTAAKGIEEALAGLSHAQTYTIAKAFTEFLRLANLCEQVHRIRRRRFYRHSGATPQRASPEDTFTRLQKEGIGKKRIEAALRDIQIELVLTAHPTETMMPQAVRSYRDLAARLLERDSQEFSALDQAHILRKIKSVVTELWLAGIVRAEKPTPVDEARYGLELAERILWHAVPHFHHLLSAAYKQTVGDMSALFPSPIRFATWMGGDRDGHPGVTAAITREVLHETSGAATLRYKKALDDLAGAYVFDQTPYGIKLQARCRKMVAAMQDKVALFETALKKGAGADAYTRLDFLKDLRGLEAFLQKEGAALVAYDDLQELIWRVRIFGLCFLRLDIRQSADVHLAALDDLLGHGYAALPEKDKIKRLTAALKKPPRLSKARRLKPMTREVLATAALYAEMPPDFLGPYVISMAEEASDLLGVLCLLKIAGVSREVKICPLFETPESLARAADVMTALYALPAYRRHLHGQQDIMVGYSDSSKRGGYLKAAWEIYTLQQNLSAIGAKHKIKTSFFHGRGGTIARGGGPIETALLALPRPHRAHRIRITEQGEAIDSKFGLPDVAERTMELYLSGFMEAVLSPPADIPRAWIAAMDRLASASAASFRTAVYETPDFMAHYSQMTPTPELDLMKIGSRPARRKQKDAGLESLRAIPWVFGWTQSRLLLPGWLGIADAVSAEIAAGNGKTLSAMYKGWPFFQAVIDLVEMVVAKADPQISAYYSRLLVEPRLQYLTDGYLASLEDTIRALLQVTGHKRLLEKSQVLDRSIRIRTPYVDVLNILQVHLLKKYRANAKPPALLVKTLALTIGGISAGMRNTG